MLTTAEALDRVLAAMPELSVEPVALRAADGRVLRQVVEAERDQPPFHRVMMDGIAISHTDFANGLRQFPILGTQMAGEAAVTLQPGSCIEIMTGASLPVNADCIIPVERISVSDGMAILEDGYAAVAQQFIHPRASDHAAGSQLLAPGKLVSAMDIAVIASAGLTHVDVSRSPVVRVISTGNELVAAGEAIEPHQVRLSNGPAIQALLAQHGYPDCEHDHLLDERAVLRERIARHLNEADVVILSGGVSMGKADFVPEVLAELGVKKHFHIVSQRPGKPMWFGTGPDGQAVFALPGNPVSSMVCGHLFLRPLLRAMQGLPKVPLAQSSTTLAAPIGQNGPRQHYMRAHFDGTQIEVAERQDSSLLSVLARANALVVRPPHDPP